MPELLKASEVAEILRITTQQVYALTKNGDLPHYPVGGVKRYSRADVIAYLEKIKK